MKTRSKKPEPQSCLRGLMRSCFQSSTSATDEQAENVRVSHKEKQASASTSRISNESRVPSRAKDSLKAPANAAPKNVSRAWEGVRKSAYEQACSSRLTPEQREAIESSRSKKPQDLFISLNQANDKQRSSTWFRSGFEKVKPVLDALSMFTEFTSPLTSLDPTGGASIAFGLTNSVLSLSIGLCGASQELDDHIKLFIESIPAIYSCDEIVKGQGETQTIYEALVRVYGDMLDFYFAVVDILQSSNFLLALSKSQYHQTIPGVISSFSTHTGQLLMAIHIETMGEVKKTGQLVQEDFIQKQLDGGREKESHFTLEQRADGSCQWLESNPVFCRWQSPSCTDSQFLTMFGGVGCGKTMTTAYVAQLLRARFEIESAGAVVCNYYCKDDGERNKIINIYRSLVSQLLVSMPRLEDSFLEWLEDSKPRSLPKKPTLVPEELRGCLVELIGAAKQWVYVVVDAIDECEADSWGELHRLCQELAEKQVLCKVFFSSRYSDSIRNGMPKKTVELQMKLSTEEARRIVVHLLDAYLPRGENKEIGEEIRQALVESISGRADGSAIWIKMILQYLQQKYLEEIPTPRPEELLEAVKGRPSELPKLYGEIYQRIYSRVHREKPMIEQALELLAFAGRPITLRELSSFLVFSKNEKRVPPQLGQQDLHKVLELIRPFVSTEGYEESIVRLVHQSLKDLILRSAPATWTSDIGEDADGSAKAQRKAQINTKLGSICLNYLRLGELANKDLFPAGEAGTDFMTMAPDLFANETPAESPETEAEAASLGPARDFDPYRDGFGGFFTYAACFWPYHVENSSDDTAPEPKALISISRFGSTALLNWSEQYRHPFCMYLSDEVLLPSQQELDPLVTAVFFKREYTARRLLQEYDITGSDDFSPSSAFHAAKWALKEERFALAKAVFIRAGEQLHTLDFLSAVMGTWYARAAADRDERGWDGFFATLVNSMLDRLLEWGPETLCVAADEGCLPLVRKLFDAAAAVPRLRDALLADRGRDGLHQSVGQAALWGRLDIVRFLCAQPGIDAHVRHRGPRRETVFHAAAECRHRVFHPELFALLIRAWPDGVDVPDEYCTPLYALVSKASSSTGSRARVEAVRLLLATGRVDAGVVNDTGNCPLGAAVSRANVDMARALVVHGHARLDSVLRFDEGGRPQYVDAMPAFEEARERVLRELCRLSEEVAAASR